MPGVLLPASWETGHRHEPGHGKLDLPRFTRFGESRLMRRYMR